LRTTFSPRGEEFASVGVSLFSPAGRRWPEGPDEGQHHTFATSHCPSSACRHRLPVNGESGVRPHWSAARTPRC
ncbi:hypothetical protein EN801_039400, partial [Mesorhizobium sp. M00.F.Ca.ET.158.01.1.1]